MPLIPADTVGYFVGISSLQNPETRGGLYWVCYGLFIYLHLRGPVMFLFHMNVRWDFEVGRSTKGSSCAGLHARHHDSGLFWMENGGRELTIIFNSCSTRIISGTREVRYVLALVAM